MVDKHIFPNKAVFERTLNLRNKTLKLTAEMYKKQLEGIKSEIAKDDGKKLGLTPAEAKRMIGLLRPDASQNLENTIAMLEHQKIRNILMSDALQIYKGREVKRPPRYPENPELLAFYDELHSKALSMLTDKKATGQDLMWKVEQINDELTYSFNNKARTFSNFADVQEAYRYFKSGKHGLTIFDLETFGGRNEYGVQEIEHILEYTFDYYKSNLPDEVPDRVTGFVGLSASKAKELTERFEQFTDLGSLSEKDQVIAKSLAKIGHADTLIEEDASVPGRFVVKRYGEASEITRESIEAGIRRAREIGKMQEAHLYEGMMAWEKDLADSVLRMQKGDMTVGGYNIIKYDLPVLNQYISQNASLAMRDYLAKHGFQGKIDLPERRIFDVLSLFQFADVHPDTMKAIWKDHSHILKSNKLTPYQQEALAMRFFKDMFDESELGAHASSFDVSALHRLITEAKIDNELLIDMAYRNAEASFRDQKTLKLKPGQKQLFYATRSLGGRVNRGNFFGFKVDQFTGSLLTMDGVELAETLSASRTFPEYMTKKGVTYTIDSIETIKTNKEYIDRMKKINPALAVNELISVKIQPVVDQDIAGPYGEYIQKLTSPSYIVAPKEDIKSIFSNYFIAYAEKGKKGDYLPIDGAENLLGKHKITRQAGKTVLQAVSSDNLVHDIIKDGTFIFINDSAARVVRENRMSRYEALSRFSKELNRMIEEDPDDLSETEKKKRALSRILNVSKNVAQSTAEGKQHTLARQTEAVKTFQELIGYKDFGTGEQVVHPKTIDNAIALLSHFESIEDEINILLEEVNKRTEGSIKAEKDYLFKKGLEAIQTKALEKMEKEHLDLIEGFVRTYESDYFDIDISELSQKKKRTKLPKAIEHSNPEGVLRINLGPGGEHQLIDALLEERKRGNEEAEAMKRLEQLVDFIQKEEGYLKDFYKGNKKEFLRDNTPITFARGIIDALRKVREKDPIAGYINLNKIHNVMGPSDIAGVFSKEELIEILEKEFEGFTPGTVFNPGKDDKAITHQARRIVSEILMDPFNEETLKSFGYNQEQITKLKIARDVREKDYVRYVETILRSASKAGMDVVADKKTGVFGLIDQGEFIDLVNVPREKFSDGMFYTQIGRSRVATELHLSMNEQATRATITSGLFEAMRETRWDLERSVERAIQRGDDPVEKVEQWINKVAKHIREGSAVTMLDEQDIKSQFEIYEKSVVDALPNMTDLERLDLKYKEEFLEIIRRRGFSFDSMDDTAKQLWTLNRETILKKVAEDSMDDRIRFIVENIVPSRGKHSAIESGRIRFDVVQMGVESHENISRDITNQSRYLAFRELYAKKQLEETGMDRQIEFGSPFRTELGRAISSRAYEGLDEITHTEFVATRKALTASSFQKAVEREILNVKDEMEKVKKEMFHAQEIAALETISLAGQLTEGGAIADARIADAIFDNYDRQRISHKRIIFTDHRDNIETLKTISNLSHVVPEIYITEAGEIQFRYKKGIYVKQGERIFDELLEFGNTYEPIGAKDEGVLRFGFFTKGQGMIANEEAVIRNVKRLAEEKGLTIRTSEDFMALAEEIYDPAYYIERLTIEPYRKLMESGHEKHMTYFAYFGLGQSGDQRILKALEEMGLGHQKHALLRKEFFEQLLDGRSISSSVFSEITTKETLDYEIYQKAIKSAGFRSEEEFKQALIRERYLPSEMLQRVLGEGEFGPAQIALINEEVKHSNRLNPVMAAISNMIYKEAQHFSDLSSDEAYRKAHQIVADKIKDVFVVDGKPSLRLGDDGRIIVPQMSFFGDDYIDIKKLEAIYDQEFGQNAFKSILNEGQYMRMSYALMQDPTRITGLGFMPQSESALKSPTPEERIARGFAKGAKITDREIEMLETLRYDEKLMEELRQKLSPEDFEHAFGHALIQKGESYALKDEYVNRPVLEGFTEEVRRLQFSKPGETLISLDEAPEHLKPYVKSMQNLTGLEKVGMETAEKFYAIDMNIKAMLFNENAAASEAIREARNRLGIDVDNMSYSLETLQDQYGFKVMSLSEIDVALGQDATYLKRNNISGIYEKNIIIDLEDDVITKDILERSGHKGRYLALGYLPAGKLGDELIQTEAHRALGALVAIRKDLQDTTRMTEQEIELKKQLFAEKLDEFNQAISKTITGKKGLIADVSSVRLEMSARGKASIFDAYSVLDSPVLTGIMDNVYIDGRSLTEHYQRGIMFDFKVISEDMFRKMGVFDQEYLDRLGMSEDEMRELLKRGVMGFSHRHPTVYEESARPTMLILSDKLIGNISIESAGGALAAKTDADGDQPASWLMRYTGSDGKITDSIEYALRQGEDIDELIQQRFQDQKAAMYINAVRGNRYFAEKARTFADDSIDIDATKLSLSYSLSPSGRMYPVLDRMPTPDEHFAAKERFRKLNEMAIEAFINDAPSLRALSMDAAKVEAEVHLMKNMDEHIDYLRRAVLMLDESMQEEYAKAGTYELERIRSTAAAMSKFKRSSAGEINLPLYQVKRLRNIAYDALEGSEHRFLTHVLEAAEEAFLSPKHSEAEIIDNALTMKEFNRAMRAVAGNPYRGDQAGHALLEEWFERNLSTRFRFDMFPDMKEQEVYSKAAQLIEKVFQSQENVRRYDAALAQLGAFAEGIPAKRINEVLLFPEESRTMMSQSLRVLSEAGGDFREEAARRRRIYEDTVKHIDTRYDIPTDPNLNSSVKTLIEKAQTKLKKINITGKDLAFGALGLAGSIMVAGFVGGNPAEPAMTQAENMQDDGLYAIPPMADQNIVVQQGHNGGYVININAKTDKERRYIEEAIKHAMAQSYHTTNINISMNIKDSSGNITDRNIEEIIRGSFS